MYKVKCAVCSTALEGRFLTLKQDSTPISISQADLENFGVTNLAFECGHEDCKAAVCHRCTAELERQKLGGFLFKREYLICPKCGKPFEVGTHFLLEGWLPPEVDTVRYEVRKRNWVFQMRYKIPMLPATDLTIPTLACCVCMSENVYQVIRMSHRQISPTNLQYTLQYTLPLCKGCHSILTHPSIESPGLPYQIDHTNPGQAWGAMSIAFVNPAFMDLVKIVNSYLFPQK
ncbi:MAG: hypothetical protein ABIG43_02295 [Chloroflexota bacterium]